MQNLLLNIKLICTSKDTLQKIYGFAKHQVELTQQHY